MGLKRCPHCRRGWHGGLAGRHTPSPDADILWSISGGEPGDERIDPRVRDPPVGSRVGLKIVTSRTAIAGRCSVLGGYIWLRVSGGIGPTMSNSHDDQGVATTGQCGQPVTKPSAARTAPGAVP
jgi:hypothetical protein